MNRPLYEVICEKYSGFLVGSAAKYSVEKTEGYEPKDYDIIIPKHKWNDFILTLKDSKQELNEFGGFRIFDEFTLKWCDIWSDYLEDYFSKVPSRYFPAYAIDVKNKTFYHYGLI